MHENETGTVTVDCAAHLHQDLGPGLLESVYEVTLARKLEKRGLSVQRQGPIAIEYEGQKFDEGWHHSNYSWRALTPSPCLCENKTRSNKAMQWSDKKRVGFACKSPHRPLIANDHMKNREQARSHKALVPTTATATAWFETIGISERLSIVFSRASSVAVVCAADAA